ncbi:MAG: FKBP-type peptidyl-prolyl cis-trans isomerase [Breznakibacter sp.]|nr:FKBP-type peptidyl-prolyl cis-trans isomerase [Breznakibacter sp.]
MSRNYNIIERIFVLLSVIILPFISVGCQQSQEPKKEYRITEEDLINANRAIVNQDGKTIERYLADSNMVMTKTNTGLWYRINEKGSGANAKVGQTVAIKYNVKLLDGTECYKSDSLGVKVFRLGQGGVESGLEEALLLMKRGGKATFILPPHLAHGLTGDNDKIPSRSIIIYEVEIVELK